MIQVFYIHLKEWLILKCYLAIIFSTDSTQVQSKFVVLLKLIVGAPELLALSSQAELGILPPLVHYYVY